MLRHAVAKSAHHLKKGALVSTTSTRRSYAAATSKQKRALSKQQVEGNKTAKPDPPSAPPPPAAAATPAAAAGGGDDGGFGGALPVLLGAGLLAAGGAYYYYGMEEEGAVEEKGGDAPVASQKEEPKEEASLPKAAPAIEKRPTSIKSDDGSNRVLQIDVPSGTRSAPPPAVSSHPEGGSRVTMESFQPASSSISNRVSIKDSLKELQDQIDQETSDVVRRANQEVMRSFDESLFEGLDEMSPSQLKARVMQLATEMKERTRWEALRLKEFLSLKEKETADKYLDVLQQQRLEFESIMARRLREQEHELTLKANAKLQEKDGAVKDMIDNAIKKLGEEHDNEKAALTERTDQEFRTKYEQTYLEKLEEFKKKAIDEMERKQSALEALNKKLGDLEGALASTKVFSEGSLQAHKLSAAALALAEKMESNKGAEIELSALKAVAGQDNVIAAALSSVPTSLNKGVPTLTELQARFEKVAKKTRQAVLVPEGLTGVEGQLAGMVLATFKFPPKPDDAPPENDKDSAEYILIQAREHVQYGELEKAVQQLDKLTGQAAFTVQGWKKDAADRVSVEQALKVIKMECALLNEAYSATSN